MTAPEGTVTVRMLQGMVGEQLTLEPGDLHEVTAAQAKVGPRLDMGGFYRQMAGGVGLAVLAAILVAWAKPGSWPVAAPYLILWLLSPAIARWTSSSRGCAKRSSPSAVPLRSV